MPRYRPPGVGPKRTLADAVEAAVAIEDRSAHHVGLGQLADILGRDRGTLSAWIDKGCPVVRRGSSGEKTILDPAAVVAWREDFVRREEASKFARPEGEGGLEGPPMKPSDLVKMEQLKLTRLRVAQVVGITSTNDVPEAAFARAFGILRQAVMALPEQMTRDMAGFPEDKKLAWRERGLARCRSMLREASRSIAVAMPELKIEIDASRP